MPKTPTTWGELLALLDNPEADGWVTVHLEGVSICARNVTDPGLLEDEPHHRNLEAHPDDQPELGCSVFTLRPSPVAEGRTVEDKAELADTELAIARGVPVAFDDEDFTEDDFVPNDVWERRRLS